MAGWRHILKSLYPWALWVFLYFVIVGTDYPVPSPTAALFKVLPVLTLAFMALSTKVQDEDHTRHRFWTILGLLFSVLGDVFMVWIDSMMTYGGLAFGAAHLCYTVGFGAKKSSPSAFVFCALLFGGLSAWLLHHIPTPHVKVSVTVYLFLLSIMLWRSSAVFLNEFSLSSACGCFGGYVFILSDMIIFLDKYAVPRIHNANLWIMLTYYVAQLGIALSVALYKLEFVDPPEQNLRRPKRSRTRFTSK